jgi:hypothetical protein
MTNLPMGSDLDHGTIRARIGAVHTEMTDDRTLRIFMLLNGLGYLVVSILSVNILSS